MTSVEPCDSKHLVGASLDHTLDARLISPGFISITSPELEQLETVADCGPGPSHRVCYKLKFGGGGKITARIVSTSFIANKLSHAGSYIFVSDYSI
ncbi:E4 control protein ORF6/7 [Mastadenovirus porcusquartum]|uniref:E4 control protein ORF6/7 n=1 Tax=Mastadenovirus porcusquartum TaxID=3241439 RepID=A0A7H0S558_9ADEN|nr:E4 control protein ORF6/7 [Porcine mastadenovirus B]QNQ79267.1 E4 control protein ORF6/7 [Porcine mastadenovirus B]